MKNLFTLLLLSAMFALGSATADAQVVESELTNYKPLAKNSIFFELGGSNIVYSLNYDRLLRDDMSIRVGVSYLGYSIESDDFIPDTLKKYNHPYKGWRFDFDMTMIPVMYNYLFGSGDSKFEVGVGPTFIIGQFTLEMADEDVDNFLVDFFEETIGSVAYVGSLAYRYQPRDGGFNFRAGGNILMGKGGVLPTAGVSFGYSF